MDASLLDVFRKVERAKRHLAGLGEELREYDASGAHTLRVEQEGDELVVRAAVLREPDPEWAITVGEIAYQARSALDQLVAQLVVLNGHDPETLRTGFPIFQDPHAYRNKVLRRGRQKVSYRDALLEGVAGPHRRMIDDLQPYQRGRRQAAHDPLALLNELCNTDKHRSPHPALLVRRDLAAVATDASGNVIGLEQPRQDGPESRRPPVIDGGEVLRVRSTGPDGRPVPLRMEQLAGSVGVCFGPSQVFFFTLERIVGYVEESVVARFAPLFVEA